METKEIITTTIRTVATSSGEMRDETRGMLWDLIGLDVCLLFKRKLVLTTAVDNRLQGPKLEERLMGKLPPLSQGR